MDDLAGMDWSTSTSPNSTSQNEPPMKPSSAFASLSSLQPTTSAPFTSGNNTPLSSHYSSRVPGAGSKASASAPAPTTTKASQDAFSNLMSMSSGSAKSTAKMSLAERQKEMEQANLKKLHEKQEQQKQQIAAYGDGQFWDSLGQRSSPAPLSRTASPAMPGAGLGLSAQNGKTESDDDLFAAFNKDTKVDNSSHYPPPASGKSTPAALDLSKPSAWSRPAVPTDGLNSVGGTFAGDDDPFGLKQFQTNSTPAFPAANAAAAPFGGEDDDDDFLGDLARPVDEVRKKQEAQRLKMSRSQPEPGKAIEDSDSSSINSELSQSPGSEIFDEAVAQLAEMGFSPQDAMRGLTESGEGPNVQAAVGYLLNEAHQRASEKNQARADTGLAGKSRLHNATPPWMTEEGPSPRDNRSPTASEADFAKSAAAVGSNLFKSANKLWNVGQKKVQKAMAELQEAPPDPSQPKWMMSSQEDVTTKRGTARRPADVTDVTDEALMLESGARPGRHTRSRPAQPSRTDAHRTLSREQSAALSTGSSRPKPVPKEREVQEGSFIYPKSRSKQAVDSQNPQAYVRPARSKKTTAPAPARPRLEAPAEPNLVSSEATAKPLAPHRTPQPPPRPRAPARPARGAPAPRPTRQIPHLDPSALQSWTRHRIDGTAHFKRGDYAAAHAAYSSSLSAVPQTHPLAIVILCNRAMTGLKTGEARQAVSDADTALELIGPGKGEGEYVSFQDQTGEQRDMAELYKKALVRKAEALEQMERWSEAGVVWQTCVESSVGGSTAIAGRQRCQKALAPKAEPASKQPAPAPVRATPRPRAAATLAKESEAVARMKAANQATEAADAEKFALSDQVDAHIAAWRNGKRENLRALLSSLDQVLWEGSGWKKVGLHELVMANRVKVIYMKAIAKTHPDKLAQDASTEVRMIAAAVFSTLNESWDKFKAENGL